MVTIEAEDGIADGTAFQIFGADTDVGANSRTLNLADPSKWDTSKLGIGQLIYEAGPLDACGLGDIDGNGAVEFADFLVLSGNFGNAVGGAASVPEPSSMLPITLAVMLGLGFRGRR